MSSIEQAQNAHVDMETLTMLKDIMEDNFANLLETYIQDSKTRLTDLRAALAANDSETVRRAAHSLKGSSGNLGANRMAALCMVVEDRGKDEELEGLESNLNAIEAEYQEVAAIMKSMF